VPSTAASRAEGSGLGCRAERRNGLDHPLHRQCRNAMPQKKLRKKHSLAGFLSLALEAVAQNVSEVYS
jgi:hypothetical protein